MQEVMSRFAWYLDITPIQMFTLNDYPIPGKSGLPLCQEHGMQLEMKEMMMLDKVVTELAPPGHPVQYNDVSMIERVWQRGKPSCR